MHVIGHGHIHGVDPVALLGQQLTPVGIGSRIGHFPGGLGQPVTVHVADRDHLGLSVGFELVEIVPAHAPHPDAGMLPLAVKIGGTGGGRPSESGSSGCPEKSATRRVHLTNRCTKRAPFWQGEIDPSCPFPHQINQFGSIEFISLKSGCHCLMRAPFAQTLRGSGCGLLSDPLPL